MIFNFIRKLNEKRKISKLCKSLVSTYGVRVKYSKNDIKSVVSIFGLEEPTSTVVAALGGKTNVDVAAERRNFSRKYLKNKKSFNAIDVLSFFLSDVNVHEAALGKRDQPHTADGGVVYRDYDNADSGGDGE